MQALRFSDTSWRVVRHHRADETRVSPRQQGYRHRVVNEVVTRGNRHQEARLDRASPRLPVQLAVAVAVGQPLAALLALGHARQPEAVSLSNHRIARHTPAKLLSNRAGRLSHHPKALQQLRSRLVPLSAHAELPTSSTWCSAWRHRL